MLSAENAVLVIIDIQGKLATLMHDKEACYENVRRLIRGASVLGVPMLWTEQYPSGMGPTIPEISELLSDFKPIPKMSFSCLGCTPFREAFFSLNRKQPVLCGIEAHICVCQTALDFLEIGRETYVVSDAVDSRIGHNKTVGLERAKSAGGIITSTEMALYEMLRTGDDPRLKEIIEIVK